MAFLFTVRTVFPQSQVTLKILDPKRKALEFAMVKCAGKKKQSNAGGFCSFDGPAAGKKIDVRRLGFADTNFVIHATPDTVTIVLRPEIIFVKKIPAHAGFVTEINPKKSAFILDYDLDKEHLVQLLAGNIMNLLGYDNTMLYNGKCPKDAQAIMKDLGGSLILSTAQALFLINARHTPPRFDSLSVDRDVFYQALKDYDESVNAVFFLKKKDRSAETTEFIAVSKAFSVPIKTIYGKEHLAVVRNSSGKLNSLTENLYGRVTPGEGLHVRTPEMIRWSRKMSWSSQQLFDRSSGNILKFVDDSVRIFAHDIDTVFVYDKALRFSRKVYIDYHHLKCWNKDLLVNEEKSRVWAVMELKHDVFLAEIDLASGHLKLPFIKINSVKAPEKIRVRGNKIFFMTKQADGIGKTVFCQEF